MSSLRIAVRLRDVIADAYAIGIDLAIILSHLIIKEVGLRLVGGLCILCLWRDLEFRQSAAGTRILIRSISLSGGVAGAVCEGDFG